METLGSGYTRVAGDLGTADEDIVTSFNEMLTKTTDVKTTIEAIQNYLGESYTLKLAYDEEGNAKEILGLIANGTKGFKDITTANQSTSTWTNPLEHHYQLLKDINKEQRNLNKLQHEYELATKVASGYTADIADNLAKQKAEYQAQYNLQQKSANSYTNDLQQLNKKYKQYADYMSYDFINGQLIVNE